MALKPWFLIRLFTVAMWQWEEDVNRQLQKSRFALPSTWRTSPGSENVSNTSNLNFTHFCIHTV